MISVVVPCYNARRWVADTIRSALHPTAVPVEVIVVDDGSTDGSGDLIGSEFPQVRLVRTENRGVSHARNLGIELAGGDHFVFLDADDLLAPGKYERQLQLLTTASADVVYAAWEKLVSGPDGEYHPTLPVRRTLAADPELDFATGFWCPTGAYLFTRRVVELVGRFDPAYPIVQDAVFAARAAVRGGKFVYDAEVACRYRAHAVGSVSTRSRAGFLADCGRHCEEFLRDWDQTGCLTDARRRAVLSGLDGLVSTAAAECPELVTDLAALYMRASAGELPPAFGPAKRAAAKLLGYERFRRWAAVSRNAFSQMSRPTTFQLLT